MKIKIFLFFLILLPSSCFASAYIWLSGGMYAAHWKSPPILENYTPTGTPEGGAWRAALGYQIDPRFSIEAGATYYDKATRTLHNRDYTIRQKSYSFLFGIYSPELFWQYKAFAKFGFAHLEATLSGLNINLPFNGDIAFPPNTVQAFRPAYVIGFEQRVNSHFFTHFQWYHIDGEANVASQTTVGDLVSIDQSIPSINIFMGGISYHF